MKTKRKSRFAIVFADQVVGLEIDQHLFGSPF
jgi:hypothetical protein